MNKFVNCSGRQSAVDVVEAVGKPIEIAQQPCAAPVTTVVTLFVEMLPPHSHLEERRFVLFGAVLLRAVRAAVRSLWES